ncbi:MAG: RIP metalloprotease RseP [Calditrichaeota bacterium]|nr:RIP metalloprotease RseP [Calditrichota bacterium]
MSVTIVAFVFVLGLLIFVHELGHFLAAKAVGIRVERFSLGFPPRLFGVKIGETDYCISAIPLGGYVKMAGMIDESLDADTIKGEPWEFMSKPLWARFLVIFAGPLMNMLLAVAIFTGLTYHTGVGVPKGPIVGAVEPGSPADSAGFKPGDRIVAIEGTQIKSWDDLTRIIHHAGNKRLEIVRERDGRLDTVFVRPMTDVVRGVSLIGIGPAVEVRRVSLWKAFTSSVSYTWYLSKLLGRSLLLMASGQVSVREGLGGPVRIAQLAGESARHGMVSLLGLIAFLSLNLGWLNLFPIPALDGGHLVLLAIEGITRRPVSNKVRLVVQQIGMVILLALMVLVIANDIMRLLH